MIKKHYFHCTPIGVDTSTLKSFYYGRAILACPIFSKVHLQQKPPSDI
jgi:hypothetical protein